MGEKEGSGKGMFVVVERTYLQFSFVGTGGRKFDDVNCTGVAGSNVMARSIMEKGATKLGWFHGEKLE